MSSYFLCRLGEFFFSDFRRLFFSSELLDLVSVFVLWIRSPFWLIFVLLKNYIYFECVVVLCLFCVFIMS